ncbi:MAG: hypothetical protein KDD01_03445 [Phaeodactylibacter sp.]|nr:hypothetical protein [Phaeodactylibacter sp.]
MMQRTIVKGQVIRLLPCLLILLFHSMAVFSQPFLTADGEVHSIKALEETYQDFNIPEDTEFGQFNLEIEGADGGWIEYTYLDRFGTKRTQRVNGGEGATVSATYRIGYGGGQLPPRSVLRLIIGNRGERAKFDLLSEGGYGAGGGGGSAALLSKDNGATWQIIMVAGGGGGGGVDTKEIDTKYNPGLPGSSGEDGLGGEHSKMEAMPGGIRGSGGQSSGITGGGGGVYEDGQHETGALYYGNAGWKDHKLSGQPLGGLGGTEKDCYNGGWGFGGGGSGAEGGGGGGGYSGGGGGTPGFGGGGGGSHINSFTAQPLTVSKKQNGDTNNPEHGRVRYQFAKTRQD